jgi:CheY-like chemotaxis protein
MFFENSSCYILLIEDNPLDVDLIRRALEKSDNGVRLDIAQDGEEALAWIKKWETGGPVPVFVILDLKLPKVDGLEILQTIKNHPRYKILPIVILTSSNELSDIQKAYALGANSYILKSIDYEDFSNAVGMIQRYWCRLNIHPE